MTAKPFGTPIPDSPHAVSVSMPAWQDVVDYEEGNPRAKSYIKSGYPRFVYHPYVLQLCEKIKTQTGAAACMVFPSRETATECANYVMSHGGRKASMHALSDCELAAVLYAVEDAKLVREYWMHSGLITSSRRAEAWLEQRQPDAGGKKAHAVLRDRIAQLTSQPQEHVFLYPSGMGAVYCAHAAVTRLKPGAKTVQLGFPYVDTLKILQKFGSGSHYVRYDKPADLHKLEAILKAEPIAAVFAEYPSNPLLRVLDLAALSALCQRYDTILVIDDTVATFANVELAPYADMVVSSLTKYFSGVGDVAAGSLVVSERSGHAKSLLSVLSGLHQDLLYGDDAVVLEKNSRDFAQRMQRINANAFALAQFLAAHPKVGAVYYPALEGKDIYDRYQRQGGGYGGLLSFTLKDETKAPAMYDRLAVTKGPSLGTNYTLVCPYTLLAHYGELEFAAASGVSSHLLRVSPGVEPTQELLRLFDEALHAA